MTVLRDDGTEGVLVVVAHPDDAEFWVGGTIARWTSAGVAVTYCVLTDGASGGFDPGVPYGKVAAIRRGEQAESAALLGVSDVRFLGFAEGSLSPYDAGIHAAVVRVIREVRPHRVVTWSPEWNWARFRSCHPDHRATGEIALRAIYPDAGNPFALLSVDEVKALDAWTVQEAWLMNAPRPNHYVDITDTFDRKVAAVAAHRSQVSGRADLAGELRERIVSNTSLAGLVEGRLAEAFQVVVTG